MANMTFGTNLIPNNTSGQKTLGNSSNKWTIYANEINCDNAIPIAAGGTGGTTAAAARLNLGLGTMAVEDASDYVTIAETETISGNKTLSGTTTAYGIAIPYANMKTTLVTGAANLQYAVTTRGGLSIASGADLNNLTTLGNYYANSSALGKAALHRPKPVSLYFYLKNYSLTGTDTAYIRQELTSYRNGTFFRTRPGASGAWSDWFCNVVTKVATATSSSDTGTTVVPGGILYGDSSTYCSYTAAGTTGQVLTSNGTAAPTWKTLIYYKTDFNPDTDYADAPDGAICLTPLT